MNPENPVVGVIDGPVRVDGGICRLVETADGGGRVESWDGRAWVPGGATVKEVLKGTPCADPETGAAPVKPTDRAPGAAPDAETGAPPVTSYKDRGLSRAGRERNAEIIAYALNVPLGTLEKDMRRNARKLWAARAATELLEGLWTWTVLIVLVVGIATSLYSCVTH